MLTNRQIDKHKNKVTYWITNLTSLLTTFFLHRSNNEQTIFPTCFCPVAASFAVKKEKRTEQNPSKQRSRKVRSLPLYTDTLRGLLWNSLPACPPLPPPPCHSSTSSTSSTLHLPLPTLHNTYIHTANPDTSHHSIHFMLGVKRGGESDSGDENG